MSNNVTLNTLFKRLNLQSFMNTFESNIESNISSHDLLIEMCKNEIEIKDEIAKISMVKTAGFPYFKTLEEFDYDFQPSINKEKIALLSSLDFINKSENIILTGTPGVGKTHIAIALGVISASNRTSTYFIKCQKLLANLKLAYDENRLDARIRQYNRYKLLIIDEMGYLPISDIEAKILFQLIDQRYERKSTIITSNISVDKWHETFSDVILANAITDRLLHHSYLFNVIGKSYRMKDIVKISTKINK